MLGGGTEHGPAEDAGHCEMKLLFVFVFDGVSTGVDSAALAPGVGADRG